MRFRSSYVKRATQFRARYVKRVQSEPEAGHTQTSRPERRRKIDEQRRKTTEHRRVSKRRQNHDMNYDEELRQEYRPNERRGFTRKAFTTSKTNIFFWGGTGTFSRIVSILSCLGERWNSLLLHKNR